LVETEGTLVTVVVHAADIQDRDGAEWVLEAAQRTSSRLTHVWADGGYSGDLVEWWDAERGITIEIVGTHKGQTTFVVAPRRWVVERTRATLGRARRLAKDYERDELDSEAQVYLAAIGSLLRRLTPSTATDTRYHISAHAA
jgi:transposase